MAVPTITLRGGPSEVVLIFASPLAANTGTVSRAAKLLTVAKNVLRFMLLISFNVDFYGSGFLSIKKTQTESLFKRSDSMPFSCSPRVARYSSGRTNEVDNFSEPVIFLEVYGKETGILAGTATGFLLQAGTRILLVTNWHVVAGLALGSNRRADS
jgi:hypothetical protein